MFRERTPIEVYRVGRRAVRVKRDDLFASPPAPPLAKLRGCRRALARLYSEGVRLVGCWDTRISALGEGVAACALEFPGLRTLLAWPARAGDSRPAALERAARLGAEVIAVRAGRITISVAEARRIVERRGGVMLPFGMDCAEAVESVAEEAASVPAKYTRGGSLVVSTGSGVTLAGILRGLAARPECVVGVSAGRSPRSILHCLRRYGSRCEEVRIAPAWSAYNSQAECDCPFPSNPYYDRKAWRFLVENLAELPGPVLFWNVGA